MERSVRKFSPHSSQGKKSFVGQVLHRIMLQTEKLKSLSFVGEKMVKKTEKAVG